MTTKKYSFDDHPDHRERLATWNAPWIDNALNTTPMTEGDRSVVRDALAAVYRTSKLTPPERVIFVGSPITAAIATCIASGAIWLRDQSAGKQREMFSRPLTEDDLVAGIHRACAFAVVHGMTRTLGEDPPKIDLRPTRAATRAATAAATDAATRAATYAATYAATAAATDAATHAATAAATAAATRAATYAATDAATRAATRADADGVACFLLHCLQWWSKFWHGGNQWSGWASFLNFFRDVAKLPSVDYSKWNDYEKLFRHCGPICLHEKFVIVADRPLFIHRDAQNRPHRIDGPYMAWSDGWALHYINGIQVSAKVTAGDFTAQDVRKERNAEIRRVMVMKYNAGDTGRYLRDVGATVIHEDKDALGLPRKLYRIEQDDDEPIIAVEVTNSTPEPDGTRKLYTFRCQPELRPLPIPGIRTEYGNPQAMTCQNAIASTYGYTGDEFRLAVET